jgi:hypothetical protein
MHRSSNVNLRHLAIVTLAACVGGLTACGSDSESGHAGSSDEGPVVIESGSEPEPDPGTDDGEVDPETDPEPDLGTDDGGGDVVVDNRLVAYGDRESEPVWRSWDGSTLDELPSVPLDFSNGDGPKELVTVMVRR